MTVATPAMSLVPRAKRAIADLLQRSEPGRFVLGVLASAFILVVRHRLCWVRHQVHWVHRYRTGTIVDLHITTRTPESWDAEVRDISFFDYTPAAGDVVVDIGAGVGHETRLSSRLVGPTGRVLAIEANPRVFGCLEDMVRRNRLTNVVLCNVAAADEPGTVLVADSDDHLLNSIVGTGDGVAVEALTLDELAARHQLGDVNLMKMNIEGAERLAVRGMGDLLQRTRHVAFSCHDFLADDGGPPSMRTRAQLRQQLEAAGFAVRTRDDRRPWVRDCLYGVRTDG